MVIFNEEYSTILIIIIEYTRQKKKFVITYLK